MAHITTAVTMLASPPQIRLSRKLPGLPSLLPLVLAMANQLWHRINGKKQGITSPDKAIDCRAFHAVPLSGGQYHRWWSDGNIRVGSGGQSCGGIKHGLHRVDNSYGWALRRLYKMQIEKKRASFFHSFNFIQNTHGILDIFLEKWLEIGCFHGPLLKVFITIVLWLYFV